MQLFKPTLLTFVYIACVSAIAIPVPGEALQARQVCLPPVSDLIVSVLIGIIDE